MADTPSIPDAVLIPRIMAAGVNSVRRSLSLLDIADKILDVKAESGEQSVLYKIMPMPHKVMFTKSMTDSFLFPIRHPKAGQNRYLWKDQPDGTSFGYLVPDAKPEVTSA